MLLPIPIYMGGGGGALRANQNYLNFMKLYNKLFK